MTTKRKLNKKIEKLEAKLEALTEHLKLEITAEELEGFGSRGFYYDAVVTKKKKHDW